MSSESTTARSFETVSREPSGSNEDVCDQLFNWIDLSHHQDIMALPEAEALLSIEAGGALKLIEEGNLCATRDETTGEWLVKTACVRAQLAHRSLSPELESEPVPTRILQATPDRPAAGASTAGSAPQEEGFDRSRITARNVQALMDSLDFASVRLEGAMYRIGYLESQVHSLEEQLKVLPEFRARAARAILTERENDILKDENQNLQEQLQCAQEESSKLNAVIERLECTWWWRILAWTFGLHLRDSATS